MATIEIVSRNADYSLTGARSTRRYRSNVNALLRLTTLATDGTYDRLLYGAENLLIIVRDNRGQAIHREIIR